MLYVTQILLQVKPGSSNPLMCFLSFSWRFSLLSDTKILHYWNIAMVYALYGSKCISIESRTYENIEKDPKITNICQGVAERGPSLWIVESGGHLGRHLGFWIMLKGELNSPGRFCLCDVWSCRIKWEKNYISQVRVCSPGCLTMLSLKSCI